MWLSKNFLLLIICTLTLLNSAYSQQNRDAIMQADLLKLASTNQWDLVKPQKHGVACLVGINAFNHPIYYTTFNNIIAAATVKANQLWPSGSSGYNLSGSSSVLTNKLAIWDGGGILGTHVELAGRITQKDNASVNFNGGSEHATHVLGTMMATGINPLVKGMSYGLKGAYAYDFFNDNTEMRNAAAGLLISNHSYGTICGWFRDTDGSWTYYGNNGDSADFNFGYYNNDAATWDEISFNNPNYLIVKAGGNNRDQNGPAIGQPYYYYDNNGVKITATRPLGISNNNGYDVIGTTGNAKNILTVGAVNGLPNGYSKKEDVVMTNFSSWGPTDDGRIKPDLVADGVNVLSTTSTGNNDYLVESGTSMATPNIAGALLLLQEKYAQLAAGQFMKSATLKGLAIHTADEAGKYPGPDYEFGWGLLNVLKAAEVIHSAVTTNNGSTSPHVLLENNLSNGQVFTMNVVATGNSPLTATICWTDPKGNVETQNVFNNPTPKLINDLDIRIVKSGTTYYPWKLNPNFPSAAATKGDNVLDNVEKIVIDSVVPGDVYTIQITHKGVLQNGAQAYSLMVSGVGGNSYCSPNTINSNSIKIDNFSFGSINYTNTTGCGGYTSLTNLSTTIKASQTIPFSLKMGSCDNSNIAKTFKLFIDFNGNGQFTDSNELIDSATILPPNTTYNATIRMPASLQPGITTLMRIVAVESSNPSAVAPCSNNINGATQDYKIVIGKPDNDIAVAGILTPSNGDYPSNSQLVAVRIINKGNNAQQNIALSAVIKQGSTVIANLSGLYPSTIESNSAATYTFQTPFACLPSSNYSISVNATIPNDENVLNNSFIQTITTSSSVNAIANTCNGVTNLSIINPDTALKYKWYNNIDATSAIVEGTKGNTVVNSITKNLYVDAGIKANVGLASKGTSSGGYQLANQYINYSAIGNVVVESVKLYTRNPGSVTFIVADILDTTGGAFSYQTLDTKTIDVYATHPSPISGAVDGNAAADNGAIFYINLKLPSGNHSLIISSTDATLFRNNGLSRTGQYPFTIPQLFSINSNSAYSNTSPSDVDFYKSFYFYLYDMKIKAENCIGDKIPIPITTSPAPFINYANDSLKSNISQGNQWYLNGTPIAGATQSTWKPIDFSGDYTVIVTDTFGCVRKSNHVIIDKIVPAIMPNPSVNQTQIGFYLNTPTSITISLITITGKKVFEKKYANFQGNFLEQLNTSNLATGMYILQVHQGTAVERTKLLVSH